MGILAAVIQRQQTGEGQFIDISMTDEAFALNAVAGAAGIAGGQTQKLEGGMLNGGTILLLRPDERRAQAFNWES